MLYAEFRSRTGIELAATTAIGMVVDQIDLKIKAKRHEAARRERE